MPLSIEIDEKKATLHCKVSGTIIAGDVKTLMLRIAAACMETGLSKVLVDVNGITAENSAVRKLFWAWDGAQMAKAYMRHKGAIPRVSVFGSPPFISDYKPGSRLFALLSIPIRTFDDKKDAEKWLYDSDS